MKTYKQAFVVIAVGMFIVPQIAFAAWWNPFTWGAPKESDFKTQVLENRVKELESMLATTSSQTVSKNIESATTSSTNETQKVTRASWWNPFSWNVSSWLPFTKKTQTVQTQDNSQTATSSTDGSASSTQKEVELLKEEAQKAKAVAESERLKAEKAKAEAETAKAEAEQQRLQTERQQLQVENDRLKAAASKEKETIQQGIYCNGKYWAQCPAGQDLKCPATGNATCTTPISSADLSRAANNKAEMIGLADKFITAQKEIEELTSYELSFVNETISKLTGHNDVSTNLLREISILYRDLLISFSNGAKDQVRNGEGIKSATQTMSVESFLDEQAVMSRRKKIGDLLNRDTISSLQKAAAQYRDDIRQWLQ